MTEVLSKEERAALRELAKERKLKLSLAESLAATLDRIQNMHPDDRTLALQLHELAMATYPEFEVKTWYGMPGYFADGKIVMFFQDGNKYKTRYSTIGFQQEAQLDEGTFWPTSFAVTKIDEHVSKQIVALITKALGNRLSH